MGSQEVTIGPMTPADLDDVMDVERLSYLTPWSEAAFQTEMMQTYTVYQVARLDDRVVGFAGMHVVWEDSHVTNIAVHPLYRGRGLGEQMLRDLMQIALLRGAKRMTLEVRESNSTALNLYRKLGFATERGAIRKGYYTDTGEDAIVMWKDPLVDGQKAGAS